MATSSSSRRESTDDVEVESEDGEVTSRKEKSLGLLCQRFLVAMNEETRVSSSREVHLETVARKMSVEKRRIYDIVNVMEALDAMSKTNKSYYRWHGLEGLPKLMADLQKEAIEEHLPERVLRVEQAMCSFKTEPRSFRQVAERLVPKRSLFNEVVIGSLVGEDASPSSSNHSIDVLSMPHNNERRTRVDGRDRQGRNSLAQLCRRFLMVLLSNPKNTRRVSLDVASTVLIKDPETEGFEPPSRSRCRRLYDIANVLVALGLIKKVHYLFGTKKIPLFVYCGPEPDENSTFDVNACIERLLASASATPLTPQMKATNAAMQHSLSLGKRSTSEANLHVSAASKMPRIKSEDFMAQASSSLMMFAELAAERLRQETELQQRPPSSHARGVNGTSTKSPVMPLPTTSSGHGMLKPQAQHSFGNFSVSPLSSPITGAKRYAVKIGNNYQMSSVPIASVVLPTTNVWTPAHFPNFMRSSMTLPQSGPLIPQPLPKPPPMPTSKPPMKHTVTNILGTSNKMNVDPLNHRNSSPFQVVKKDSLTKQPFGSLHNLPNRY
ncbi:Transcription factor E2F/dimerization partner [Trichostrongylus colubriformis]|uniref:Transcription factor E2F/dimerization partner n=1 Tax=Trichostrongylus colubriformis TaxID=6319 RepID=A0AAN8IB88_TRICO